ncbi:uridine kinase [Ilyonectria robusta]
MSRSTVLATVISLIPDHKDDCTLIGIDGRDGAGKTYFADELAHQCSQELPRDVIRISIDDFHHPKSIRYRRGKTSPEGFWLDSYDYDRFFADVVTPLSRGGSRRYRMRSHDIVSDAILDEEPVHEAAPASIVIVDGIFLHRPELADVWHMSIFLDVSAEVCADRMLTRDGVVTALEPSARYYGGQDIYFRTCQPHVKATVLIDNSVLDSPVLKTRHIPDFEMERR